MDMTFDSSGKGLVSCFVLYLSYQEQMYIEYHSWFRKVRPIFITDKELESLRVLKDDMAPDICSACGQSFGSTIAGRVRDNCPYCKQNGITMWNQRLLRFWWDSGMSECLLGLGYDQMNYYLSQALFIYKEVKWQPKK